MEGGRNEILNWLNDTLQLNYTKIEQTATGAAHCQLMDILFPGKLPLSKVNYNAKYDYEYINNFSLLQQCFQKLGVDKYQGAMDVDRMVTGRPQANLDFCQWMKKFYDLHYDGTPYNALERRVAARINYEGDKALLASLGPNAPKPPPKPAAAATSKTGVSKPSASSTAAKPSSTLAPSRPSTTTASKPASSSSTLSGSRPSISKPSAAAPSRALGTKPTVSQPSFKPTTKSASVTEPATATTKSETVTTVVETVKVVDPALVKELEEKAAKIEELTKELTDLKLTMGEVEKDRDFFYNKLREVEIYCQENEKEAGGDILKEILKVLYKDGDNEGEATQGEGEVVGDEEHLDEPAAEDEVIDDLDEEARIMDELQEEEQPLIDDEINFDNDEPLLSKEQLEEESF